MTDPIADLLTRIRNAQVVNKTEVVLPYSKVKLSIAQFLSAKGWVGKVEKIDAVKNQKGKKVRKDTVLRFDQIKIEIKYKKDRTPQITSIERISKPGRRIYVGKDKLPRVLNGFGMAVISTSSGLMNSDEAKKAGLGGEVICQVY